MDNIGLLVQILQQTDEYYVVAKKNEVRRYGTLERDKDYIYLISIPSSIDRGKARSNITLEDLEKLRDIELNNICLSHNYAPFQYGITMYNITQAYPITGIDVKSFLKEALSIESFDVWKYKELIPEPVTNVIN